MKEKFELEYLLKTSIRVLDNMIGSPSGLSEWFADNVTVRDDIYSFEWDGTIEEARLIQRKMNSKMKFKWLDDEENGDDYYFEINFEVDSMTSTVSLNVIDFAEPGEIESAKMLWEQQINDLKRIIGA